jgi:hypothetical protein
VPSAFLIYGGWHTLKRVSQDRGWPTLCAFVFLQRVGTRRCFIPLTHSLPHPRELATANGALNESPHPLLPTPPVPTRPSHQYIAPTQIHFPPRLWTIHAAPRPRKAGRVAYPLRFCLFAKGGTGGAGRCLIPRSRLPFFILASLRPRTVTKRVHAPPVTSHPSRAPAPIQPVYRTRANPLPAAPAINSRRPAPTRTKTEKHRKTGLLQMSLCLFNSPQNRAPKWELSLAPYENTALSERQLWTILGVFHPQCLSALRPTRGEVPRKLD